MSFPIDSKCYEKPSDDDNPAQQATNSASDDSDADEPVNTTKDSSDDDDDGPRVAKVEPNSDDDSDDVGVAKKRKNEFLKDSEASEDSDEPVQKPKKKKQKEFFSLISLLYTKIHRAEKPLESLWLYNCRKLQWSST